MSNGEGKWVETLIAGHPADVFEPGSRSPTSGTVVYLHGVNQTRLVSNEVFTRLFGQHGLRVVAPLTGPSWWTDRICQAFDPALTAERHVRENVLAWIAQAWDARPPHVALLGTSMGGQGALRLSFKLASTFPIVAAISPAIDFQWRIQEGDPNLSSMYIDAEAARQDTALLHIHALNWPRNIWFCCDPADVRWHESAEKLRMKLYSLGIPHECDLETEAGGHGFEYYDHMAERAIGFIVQRLQQERARVV